MYNVEDQYLDLLNTIMVTGQDRKNRTDVKTRMTHGVLLRHNMDCGFPLLTSKKINFEAVKAELLWFLSGSTDAKVLDELNPGGFNIWAANAKAFHKRFAAREEARRIETGCYTHPYKEDSLECGHIYGELWRNYPLAEGYCGDDDYDYESKDQIGKVIDLIINEPSSRRIIVNGWNTAYHHDDTLCALPPCHVMHQIDVDQDAMKLNMSVYLRSSDAFLGLPFNLASYALLLSIYCEVVLCISGVKYKPGMLVMFIHDAHIYHNHFEQVATQLSRKDDLYPLPKVNLEFKESLTSASFYEPRGLMSSIKLVDYKHHPYIKAEMVV